jgi:hypothetical protein
MIFSSFSGGFMESGWVLALEVSLGILIIISNLVSYLFSIKLGKT